MDRREALRNMAPIGCAILGGCSSFLDQQNEEVILGKIQVLNFSLTPQRVRIIVTRNGENLTSQEIELDHPPNDNTNATVDWTTIEPSWDLTKAKYTVEAVHIDESGDTESESYSRTFTQKDYEYVPGDPQCLAIGVEIGSLTEKKNPPIEIHPTNIESPCG